MATPPDFTTGQVLTAAQMNAVGLWLIDEVTLNAVTNNISDVFSSDFDAYRLIVTNLSSATGTTRQLYLRFRNSSGNDTTANYFWGYRLYYGVASSGDGTNAGQTFAELSFLSSGASNGGSISIDISNPNLPCATTFNGTTIAYQGNVGSYVIRNGHGGINTNTVYTGLSILGTTDNLSGTARIYGYRK